MIEIAEKKIEFFNKLCNGYSAFNYLKKDVISLSNAIVNMKNNYMYEIFDDEF